MKKLLTFISFILIISACESTPPNPLYLDTNGVTVKAHKWAKIGDEGIINGVRYTIVDGKTLRDLIRNGDSYDRVCTTFIADMGRLFRDKITSQDISSWDVSNVQSMYQMFFDNHGFNCDISIWDVSNVRWMVNIFYGAISFNQDLSSWDVNQVVDYSDFDYYTPNWTLPKPKFK